MISSFPGLWVVPYAILNSPMELLKSNSGVSTTTAAHNIDTLAISGLGAKDRLVVAIQLRQDVADATGGSNFSVRNDTDAVAIAPLDNGTSFTSGKVLFYVVFIGQYQDANTRIGALVVGASSAVNATHTVSIQAATFTTAWTGSWTLALRSAGQAATGEHEYSWAIYKLIGA